MYLILFKFILAQNSLLLVLSTFEYKLHFLFLSAHLHSCNPFKLMTERDLFDTHRLLVGTQTKGHKPLTCLDRKEIEKKKVGKTNRMSHLDQKRSAALLNKSCHQFLLFLFAYLPFLSSDKSIASFFLSFSLFFGSHRWCEVSRHRTLRLLARKDFPTTFFPTFIPWLVVSQKKKRRTEEMNGKLRGPKLLHDFLSFPLL